MEQNNENSTGPVIAIIIVLAMVVLGGVYFWGERQNTLEPNTETATSAINESNVEEVASIIESQSTSDDATSMQSDLENTNIDSIGSDLNNL